MSTQPKINILCWGGSHQRRITKHLRELCINTNFMVYDKTIPGLSLSTLSSFPLREAKRLKEQDFLIIQVGGNDIFIRDHSLQKIPKKNNIFHLEKFLPNSEEILSNLFVSLGKMIDGLICKILIIDNPFRHLFCCPTHSNFKNILRVQTSANKILHTILKEKAQTLSHFKVFGISCKEKRLPRRYASLQPDSVHFEDRYYRSAAEYLLRVHLIKN